MKDGEMGVPGPEAMITVWTILPIHEVQDQAKLAALVESLRRDGWTGRPLLVERCRDQNGHHQAWTGSHRLAAAMTVDMAMQIPVVWLDLDPDTEMGAHPRDSADRLRYCTMASEAAIALMEIEAQEAA